MDEDDDDDDDDDADADVDDLFLSETIAPRPSRCTRLPLRRMEYPLPYTLNDPTSHVYDSVVNIRKHPRSQPNSDGHNSIAT